MSRLTASIIWYRARSGDELTARLKGLLNALGAAISDENSTIDPKKIPELLVKSLKNTDITVIVGGLDLHRDEENIVHVLSRCLSLKLEKGECSRSKYIYDPLRGRILPTFESAILFPSAFDGPEGMAMFSGDKTIILLPWMDRSQLDIVTAMQKWLPDMIHSYEPPATQPEEEIQSDESALPDYIERAAAKHRPPPVKPDEELNPSQLRSRLLYHDDKDLPEETNHTHISGAVGAAMHEPIEPQAEDIVYIKRKEKIHSGTTPLFRIMTVLIILAVIIGTCCIAYFYEPDLSEQGQEYQSELAALYNDSVLSENLPQFALPEFSQLYETNPNTRGFLRIEGTDFAQPVVQTESGSKIAYSGLDFYNSPDARGTLYFDDSNKLNFGSDNSNFIVYGNSPSDGSMFSILQNYTNADFLAEHPVISMDTLYEKGQWLIFSVCIVSGDTVNEFNYLKTDFIEPDSRQTHLYNLNVRSLFYTQTEVFPTDDLLTLVTDSSAFKGAKLLVCARKVREDESAPEEKKQVVPNELVLMPDIWYAMNGSEAPSIPAVQLPVTTRDTITVANITDEYGQPIYVSEHTLFAPSNTTTQTTVASEGGTTVSSVSPAVSQPTTISRPSTLPDMRITSGGTVITGSAEEILAMIIEAEMGSEFELEALKAQAVASYTYYLYGGGSAKAPSFSTKAAGQRAIDAARAVAGQYMTYKGTTAYTPYFAISAGKTANNADMNGTELAYLTSVDCDIDKSVNGYCSVKEISATEVAARVLEKKGIDLNQIADKNSWFTILERDANDLYVTKVKVGNETFRGNTLHMSILGYTCLRSPCFRIEYTAETDKFRFISYGYGSGVGMSQIGANEYAKQGNNYVWILQHFYTDITITNN